MDSSISIKPFGRSRAAVLPPGSKSITNRAMILAVLAGGKTVIRGALFSRDTVIMADCLSKLGYMVKADPNELTVEIDSALGQIPNSEAELNVGNAGTAARFITAFAALRSGGKYYIDSDNAMYSRPIKGLVDALKSQGAKFEFLGKPDSFPFVMHTCGLAGGKVEIDAGESSQMLSGLLMAAAGARSPLEISLSGGTVSKPFVAMTLKMMSQFGFSYSTNGGGYVVEPFRASGHPSREYLVEPDATAASYFATLPAVVGGVSEIENFGACKLQGDAAYADIIASTGLVSLEKSGDNLLVSSSEKPVASEMVEVDFNDISDTFLTLAAISPLLPFKLKITGIGHTRRQETDRVAAAAQELRKFCAEVEEGDGELFIAPYPRAQLAKKIRGEVLVKTYGDHRIAMSFAIAGCCDLRGDGSPWIKIENPECTSKTWAEFFEVLYTAREDSKKFRVVAVDGGAAVGKSSVSKECSAVLGYMHVDTGAHYRTLSYGLLEKSVLASDVSAVENALKNLKLSTVLDGNSARLAVDGKLVADAEIRTERINSVVAQFAAVSQVREFLKSYQRSMSEFARANGFDGMIMEGRDIGSVIFPDADARIFLDADEATRAARRAKEGISDSIKKRDQLDRTRKAAPLICPEGASLIDTSRMTKDEVVKKTLSIIIES